MDTSEPQEYTEPIEVPQSPVPAELPPLAASPPQPNNHGRPRNIFEAIAIMARPIEVDLQTVFADGKPAAIRMHQVQNIVWSSEGRSFPIMTGRRVQAEDPGGEQEADREFHEYGLAMLPHAVYEARTVVEGPDGTLVEEWIPLRLVPAGTATPGANEMCISDFDQYANVRRCFNALLVDYNAGGIVADLDDGRFRRPR